ncbi:MAG: hypothetical protein JW734_09640 [Candidatus Omnitrophica bacterium]|nr:hypothetical protein [Candidatus Omnitrophota bacterium]
MIFDFLFKRKEKKVTKKTKKISSKKPNKKPVSKPSISKKPAKLNKPKEELIGKISHFFPKVSAGVIKLKKPLSAGDTIHVKGHSSDFTQKIISLQIENKPVKRAIKGKLVGFLSKHRVRKNDKVYKVKER